MQPGLSPQVCSSSACRTCLVISYVLLGCIEGRSDTLFWKARTFGNQIPRMELLTRPLPEADSSPVCTGCKDASNQSKEPYMTWEFATPAQSQTQRRRDCAEERLLQGRGDSCQGPLSGTRSPTAYTGLQRRSARAGGWRRRQRPCGCGPDCKRSKSSSYRRETSTGQG